MEGGLGWQGVGMGSLGACWGVVGQEGPGLSMTVAAAFSRPAPYMFRSTPL